MGIGISATKKDFFADIASLKNDRFLFVETCRFLLVGATGLEPTTSSSQNWRATNCATPRYLILYCDYIYGLSCGRWEILANFAEL